MITTKPNKASHPQAGNRRPRARLALPWTAVVLGLAVPAPADRLDDGHTSWQRVAIVDLDGFRVAFRTPGGELRFKNLDELERIQVDSTSQMRDFNEAERLRHAGKLTRAIPLYERSMRQATSFWLRLARARMLQVCDRADRLDLFVPNFISLLNDESAGVVLAAHLLPRHAPQSPPRGLERMIRRVNERMSAARSQSGRVVLELLRFWIADQTARPRADAYAEQVVAQPVPLAISVRSVFRIRASALVRWAAAGHADRAIPELNEDIKNAPDAVVPVSLMAKARILFDQAKDKKELIRSSWEAMRVVVHFPQDRLVPEALLLTARVVARLGRDKTALRLIDECLKHPMLDSVTRTQAEKERDRLNASVSMGG